MNAIRSLASAQAFALAVSLSLGCSLAYAETSKDEPTLEDLKNSKERNVILLPRAGSNTNTSTSTSTKSNGHEKSTSSTHSAVRQNNNSASKGNTAHDSNSKSQHSTVQQSSVKPVHKNTTANVSSVGAPKAATTTQATGTTQSASTAKATSTKTATAPNKSNASTTSASKQRPQNTTAKVHRNDDEQVVQTSNAQSSDSIINVWLDRKGSTYKHGDKMKINVSASQDCNVMIFDFDGRGKLTQLYPNEYQQKTLLRAGDTITFGGADSPFDYQVSLPKGSSKAQERIFVYAYPLSEKPLSIALNSEDGSPFRSGEMTLSQYKKMVAESKVFFNGSSAGIPGAGEIQAGERDVKIVPKATSAPSLKLVSNEDEKPSGMQPNKKEVSFTILGR